MNYKEFFAWCRARERDRRWDHNTQMLCNIILKDIKKHPVFMRKRRFDRLNLVYGIDEMVLGTRQKKGESM